MDTHIASVINGQCTGSDYVLVGVVLVSLTGNVKRLRGFPPQPEDWHAALQWLRCLPEKGKTLVAQIARDFSCRRC